MTGSTTRIQLCGRITVEIEGRQLERLLPGGQGRLLFVHLATRRLRPTPRSMLIDALWPGHVPASADATLSSLLSRLRAVLGRDVLVGRTDLQLVLPPGARVDLEIAAEAIHRAESANAGGEWTRALIPARVALHVASRDFLPGDDAPWIDERRRWIADLRVRALDCVGTAGLGVGGTELAAAERSGRTLIELEPLRESGYRLLMQALAARGDSAQALIVYERLRRLLRDELGTTPSRATQALHRSLLAGSQ